MGLDAAVGAKLLDLVAESDAVLAQGAQVDHLAASRAVGQLGLVVSQTLFLAELHRLPDQLGKRLLVGLAALAAFRGRFVHGHEGRVVRDAAFVDIRETR